MMKILISGAGVAGAAAAHQLGLQGHDVTVVERASGLRTGGQAVDLRGAGRTVIERAGLMSAARAVALDQRGMSWVDARGRVLATMPVDAFGGEGMVSEIEILRDDLVRLLAGAAEDTGRVQFRFGDRVTRLAQDERSVRVQFTGAPAEEFDLVIGADGVGSQLRRLVLGEATDIGATGNGATTEAAGWRPMGLVTAWFTVPDPGDLDGWYQMQNEPGGRVLSIRPGRAPGEAKASLSVRVPPGAELPTDRQGQLDLLAERFVGVGGRAPELLAAMRTAPDFAFTPVGQVHLSEWTRGRVALIGDAASCPSPLTGLGTSLALVQAYTLAGELGRTDDHRSAFAAYQRVCRPYVEQAQEMPLGRGAGGFAPMGRFMLRLQTLSMRMMLHWPVRPMLERQFAKAGAVDLPEYGTVPSPR